MIGSVGTHAQSQTLYKKPPYNSAEDFTAVAFLGETPIALTVRKDLPVNNLKEFIDYAKKNQDKMQFGSAGAGSATHLGCVVLNTVMGTNITHVPYRGTGPAMQDLHGGRIDFLCEIINTAKPHIECRRHQGARDHDQGALAGAAEPADRRWSRACRVSKPIPGAPPSCPRARPPEIVKKLNAALVEAMDTPSVKERLRGHGRDDRAGRIAARPNTWRSSCAARSRSGKGRSRRAAPRWIDLKSFRVAAQRRARNPA